METSQSTRALTRLLFIILLLLSPALAAAVTHDVQVRNNIFIPAELTIEVGDTVRWTNTSGFHDVTADDNSFGSERSNSFVFERTFMDIAEILYYCSVHSSPGTNGMNGLISVVAATASAEISVDSVDAGSAGYQVGDSVDVTVTLTNSGDGDSGMFDVTISVLADGMDPTELGTIAVNNVAAGTTMDVNGSFVLPAGLATSSYTIQADSDLNDGNTMDNSATSAVAIFVFTEFIINAGLNDAWFNPVTDGQGFFITVFPDKELILIAWFTYDTELPPNDAMANLGDPGHRWLLALGDVDGNMSVMTIEIASGGIFDTAGGVTRVEDGSITLEFTNCNEGTASYNIPSIDAQGVVPIKRVAKDNISLCRTLLTELTQ